MPQALADYISKAMSIADKRNLAKENPVVVTLPQENDVDIITVVSHLEPNHITLPFNVTWIVADPADPDYMKALRRVSALPFSGRRNTWAILTVYQDIFDEPQFYDRSASFQLGEVQTSGVQPATVDNRGIFNINTTPTDPENPIVIGDNDDRMSDARPPQPHDHALLPSIALEGSSGLNDFYVNIEDSLAPVAGQALMITGLESAGVDGEPDVWSGIWRNVTSSDIDYDGATFDSLTINSPAAAVDEGTSVVFTADAHFSDSSTINSVPVSWSIISNGTAASISSTTGVLTAGEVNGDQVVRVQARWTHPESGTEQIDTYDITITDITIALVLDHIEISGPVDVNENTQGSYTVTAFYDDGSSAGVTPGTFTSSNPGAGTFDSGTGVLTVPELLANQLTTISASYTENGTSKSATLDITAHDLTVYPLSAVINGPTTISENSTETYTMTVSFSDLSSSVVAISNWATSNPAAGSIDSVSGVFTAPSDLGVDETTTISASYSSEGRVVSGTLEITAVDTTNYPVSAAVVGVDSIDEGAPVTTMQLEVTFTDTTTAIVAVTDWSSDNASVATITPTTGELTPAVDLEPDSIANISASYTAFGVTVTGTKEVTVRDITNYPISGEIVGSGSMNENSTQSLILRVTYLDTSTSDVVVSNWTSSDAGVASINPTTGLVTAATNLIGNGVTSITCSYDEHGRTITPNAFTINVIDATAYPVSASIIGLSTINENTTTTYQLEVTFDDATVSTVPVTDWAIDNPAAGTLDASTGELITPTNVTSDKAANITASYTLDGTTVNASLAVTVTDDTVYPASAAITTSGSTNVPEGTTETFTLVVTFTDASTQTVTVDDWASSVPTVGSINSNTGIFSALNQVGNQTTDISASYTADGVTVSDTATITVVDTTIYPQSAEIIGASAIDEGGTTTLQFRVTYTDSSTVVESISNWSSDNPSVATIDDSTGLVQATANVIGAQSVTISGSFTKEGVTVSDTHSLSINDTTVYPASAVILGSSSVDEGNNSTYQLEVTYTDSTTGLVSVTDWALDNASAGSIVATTGVFTAASNSTKSDITGQLTASYTLDGVTVNASKTIAVVDTTLYPVSATILGSANKAEGSGVETYQFQVTYSDGSLVNETVNDWASSNTLAGTIVATSGAFTPAADLPNNETTSLTASFTAEGETVNASLDVTVVDATVYPQSAAIIGPSTLDEGLASSYIMRVTYTDASTSDVTVDDWSSDDASLVIDSATGAATAQTVVDDQTANISASFTEASVTVNATLAVTVVDTSTPVSVEITGASTATAGGQPVNLAATVTYDDASTGDQTANGTWASSNSAAGTIDPVTGVFTPVSS